MKKILHTIVAMMFALGVFAFSGQVSAYQHCDNDPCAGTGGEWIYIPEEH